MMSALSMYGQRFPIRFHIRRSILIKRIFALLLTTLFLAGTAATLAACNTVEGAGKDIEAGGDAIKDEACRERLMPRCSSPPEVPWLAQQLALS
jgi:predicted small secreted protein